MLFRLISPHPSRHGAFAPSFVAAALLGVGTAMVYPTLIAAVSDASQPRDRPRIVGVYCFWRDLGFVLGALIAGIGADATSAQTAILIVALLAGASGAKLLERHRFERIETGQLVDTYARSRFEDTRRKAQKHGARGTTLEAYKPSA